MKYLREKIAVISFFKIILKVKKLKVIRREYKRTMAKYKLM